MKTVTQQQIKRRYRLHYNLRKKGNEVETSIRLVTKRAKVVTDIENKWLRELVDFGYSCGDGLFTSDF